VRRHRMGFIKLAAPVSHVWYLKGIPSYVAILLDMPLRDVEQIVYFNCYTVLDAGDHKDLKYKQLLTEDEWLEIEDEIYAEDSEIENEPVVKHLRFTRPGQPCAHVLHEPQAIIIS
jgi:DNA-directed RNA polymerase subunit beta'